MAYIYSIIIHGVVFIVFLSLSKFQKMNEEIPEPLLLEYQGLINDEDKSKATSRERSKSKKSQSSSQNESRLAKKKRSQSTLNVKLTPETLSQMTVLPYSELKQYDEFNHGNGEINKADNPESPWGEGGSEFGRLMDYAKMEKMNLRLKNIINYPVPFTERRIGGIVKVRLVVDEKGECRFKDTVISSLRSELKFYILNVLKLLCRGYEWRKIKLRPSTNLDFSFDFSLYSKKPFSIKNLGNVFLVHLPGHQDKGNWKLGPIQGHSMFPGFLLLNPNWIEENWNQLIHDIDPMERFKETKDDQLLGVDYP